MGRLDDLVAELDAAGESYELLPPDHPDHLRMMEWFNRAFPIAFWGRVDWSRVAGAEQRIGHGYPWLIEELRRVVAGRAGPAPLTVMWTDAKMPMLRAPAAAVAAHAESILAAGWDTWVLDPDAEWCLEFYHEDELCWGSAPAHEEGAP